MKVGTSKKPVSILLSYFTLALALVVGFFSFSSLSSNTSDANQEIVLGSSTVSNSSALSYNDELKPTPTPSYRCAKYNSSEKCKADVRCSWGKSIFGGGCVNRIRGNQACNSNSSVKCTLGTDCINGKCRLNGTEDGACKNGKLVFGACKKGLTCTHTSVGYLCKKTSK